LRQNATHQIADAADVSSYFLVNRKTGAMDLIKGESRKVDRISCRKHDSLIPIPVDERPANKF